MNSLPYLKHTSVLRVLAVAGTATAASLLRLRSRRDDEHQDIQKGKLHHIPSFGVDNEKRLPTAADLFRMGLRNITQPHATTMQGLEALPSSVTLAASPKSLDGQANETRIFDSNEHRANNFFNASAAPIKEYDFVVVGNGIAGKSAVETLRQVCPQASIAVIDPIMNDTTKDTTKSKSINDNVDFYHETRCEGFHPHTRQVLLSSSTNPTPTRIRYQHAVLVATGSRGAPPPHYLLDERALGRILELRPTVQSISSSTINRPIWNAPQIRQTVLQAAKQGKKVAVIGSGWDAVALAVAISSSAPAAARQRNKSAASMVFGGKGPLSHIAPQYLSAAVSKRLTSSKHKIEIFHRSLIRYIGSDQLYNKESGEYDKDAGLQLYTAKSYDLLDAASSSVQWLVGKCIVYFWLLLLLSSLSALPVSFTPHGIPLSHIVAPEVSGSMGTAALPTATGPAYLEEAREGRCWYQTWSQMTKNAASDSTTTSLHNNNLLACYADDGRIAVNAELSAGNGVYAAGSVAKYPNPWTGNADVAGVGLVDGTEAGRVAAYNMARDYYQRQGSLRDGGKQLLFGFVGGRDRRQGSPSSKELDLSRDVAYLKHPIPVWRSDQLPLAGSEKRDHLKEAGIYALCIGTCDSERFSTQAFWWTNQSRRLKQWLGEDGGSSSKRKGRLGGNPTSNMKPVYGRGVVYYMDQDSGRIQGVMIWGLPFTNSNDDNTLNSTLVKHVQRIIQTNGGFRNLGQDSETERVQFVQYLTDNSRLLVVEAIEPFAGQSIDPEDLPRPLIRYTEVHPAGVRRVRVLKRKLEAQGHGFLGEDLFARSVVMNEVPPGPFPNFNDCLLYTSPSPRD